MQDVGFYGSVQEQKENYSYQNCSYQNYSYQNCSHQKYSHRKYCYQKCQMPENIGDNRQMGKKGCRRGAIY